MEIKTVEYKSQFNIETDLPIAVEIIDGDVIVALIDGRTIITPLSNYPWLQDATPEQQANTICSGDSIYWPDLDEGFDTEWLLYWQTV